MKLFKRKNNKGFSLVEMICAVAILSVIGTAIGSTMIVSTQNYQRGNNEVEVQKEAQTATNLIGNLLVDAVDADYVVTGNIKTLTIDGEGITYVVEYDASTKEIKYQETVGLTTTDGILATDVADFDVDLSQFDDFKSASVEMVVEKNGKNYETNYSTTARNGSSVTTGAAAGATISCETEVILEPGQDYFIPINVYGMDNAEAGITFGSLTGVDPVNDIVGSSSIVGNPYGVTITVGDDAKGTLSFNVRTKDDPSTSPSLPYDSKNITVNIRRVNDIALTPQLESGDDKQQGAVYRIYADAIGTHFAKAIGRPYDDGSVNPAYEYKDPRRMSFDISMPGYNVNDYVEGVVKKGDDEDVEKPYVEFKLKNTMPANSEIIIRSTSKHANGTHNKMNDAYDNVYKDYILKNDKVITLNNGLMRGQDCLDFSTTLPLEDIKDKFGGEMKWLFRYRAEGDLTWSQYYRTLEGGSEQKLNASETYLFDPEKRYEYELIFVCLDEANKKITWPHDTALLQPGKGFTELGFTQGWTEADKNDPLSADSPNEYSATFTLDEAKIVFVRTDSDVPNGDYKNLPANPDEVVLCAGSSANPFVYSKSAGGSLNINYDFENLYKGASFGITYLIEEYNATTGKFDPAINPGFSLQTNNGGSGEKVKFQNLGSANTGVYRVGLRLEDKLDGYIENTTPPASVLTPLTVKTTNNGNVYDLCGTKVVNENGVDKTVEFGYIYLTIQN